MTANAAPVPLQVQQLDPHPDMGVQFGVTYILQFGIHWTLSSKSKNLAHIQTSSCDQTVSLNQAQAKSNQSSNCNKLTHTHNVKTSQTMFNLIHSQPIKNLPESNTVDSQVNLINSKIQLKINHYSSKPHQPQTRTHLLSAAAENPTH